MSGVLCQHPYCTKEQLIEGNFKKEDLIYVEFYSQGLKNHERNLSALDLELLGVIKSLRKFHYAIHNFPIVLYTDHKPLTYL